MLPGESEIEAKRRLRYMYQENLITKFKIFENPDHIWIGDTHISYEDKDAIPFAFIIVKFVKYY